MLIIPAIDIIDRRCVRLFKGDYAQKTVYAETPAEMAKKWQSEGAECLHVVDLDGAKAGQPVNVETVAAIAKAVSIPIELGGGVRNLDAIKAMLDFGVSRVILGTVACEDPELVDEATRVFGAEKIVIGIDARDGKAATRGWLEDSGQDALALAKRFAAMGVRRFIYTDISRDGALSGPNVRAMGAFCDAVPNAAVIASGGVAAPDHVRDLVALNRPNLEGAIVGKALYDGKTTFDALRRMTRASV